jgi:5'-phosphate synthase pdxT subunit
MEPLSEFVKTKSVWGTCAGAILLARSVTNPKKGGQELLGGVSVEITRNGWGSQVRHHTNGDDESTAYDVPIDRIL